MRRWSDSWLLVAALLGAVGSPAAQTTAPAPEPANYRQRAPIDVKRPASFVQMALPMSVYTHAQQPSLADLRVVDARGERVPYTLLQPRIRMLTTEQSQALAIYPLPQRPAADGSFVSPLEVTIKGDQVRVTRTPAAGLTDRKGPPSAGWLIDLGETGAEDVKARPAALRLQWSDPPEFSAAFDWESSDDLRVWRPGGSGQLMMVMGAFGTPLKQDLLPFARGADAPGRFVRLYWRDGAQVPVVHGVQLQLPEQRQVEVDATTTHTFTPSAAKPDGSADTDAERALEIDLGGLLPLADISLQWADGNRVAPLRVMVRGKDGEPWRMVAQGLVYRLERDGKVSLSPPLPLAIEARHLRVIPDERGPKLDPAQTRIVVRMRAPSLVFAMQGRAPYSLLVGSADAPAGAMPARDLIPSFDQERERFGRAQLGNFTEVPEVARAIERAAMWAAWRPRLLWAVLLIGVAGLGFMVWRLAKSPKPTA